MIYNLLNSSREEIRAIHLLHLNCLLQISQLAVPADCWECPVHPSFSLNLGTQWLPLLGTSEAPGEYFWHNDVMQVQVYRWGPNSEPLFLLNKNQTCDTSLRQTSKLVSQLQEDILGLSITPCRFGCLCQSNNYNSPSDETEQATYNTKENYTTIFRLLFDLFT